MTVLAGFALLAVVRDAVGLVMELPIAELHPETRLIDDLGVDSLAAIEIAEVTEERLRQQGLDVLIDDDMLAHLTTLAAFVDAVDQGQVR